MCSSDLFGTNAARLENAAALRSEIERTLASFKVGDLCHDLMRSGVPAGAVNTVPQAFAQAHVAHRQMLIDQDGRRALGIPVKLAGTPGRPGLPPPRYGEHGREILTEAGFDGASIDALLAAGILKTTNKP